MEYSPTCGIIWATFGVKWLVNIPAAASGIFKDLPSHQPRSEVLENLNESHPGPRQRVADVGIEPLIWEPGRFEIWKIHGQIGLYGTYMENI
jgi:hypothetical protein